MASVLNLLMMAMTLATLMANMAQARQDVIFSTQNFSSSLSDLVVLGQTLVNASDGSLDLTYNSSGAMGPYFISRVLHSSPVPLYDLGSGLAASFNTSFTFSIRAMDNDTSITGDGFTFIIAPDRTMPTGQGASAGSLGTYDVNLYKSNNASLLHFVAVEYDTFVNIENHDPDDHHVGLDIDSLISVVTGSLPSNLVLKSTNLSRRLVTWIDYDAFQQQLDVYLAVSPTPNKSSATKVLSYSYLRLWDYALASSYVGFTASTGLFQERNTIHSWNFSSHMVSIPVPPPPPPSSPSSSASIRTKLLLGLIIGLGLLLIIVALLFFYIKKMLAPAGLQLDTDLMTAPRKFTYKELRSVTGGFKEVLGHGGSGKVYKGLITTSNMGAEQVAVKRISNASKQGEKEFKSEVLTIGRIRHRNLVHLYGWCTEKGELMLMYQFMPNGSVDKLLYPTDDSDVLSWSMRFSILKGVASALVYLHVDSEKRIIHRDIKASNVMLDSNLNARLGDFGLARFFDNDQYCTESLATGVAGTWGYMAPEYAMSGRVTMESDVYSYGVLALEIACGRRPLPGPATVQESLVDYAWRKHEEGNVIGLADKRLEGEFDAGELKCVICIGLLCTHPDPTSRLKAAQVLQILRGDMELPELPVCKPMAIYVQVPTNRVYGPGVLASTHTAYTSDSCGVEEAIDISAPR